MKEWNPKNPLIGPRTYHYWPYTQPVRLKEAHRLGVELKSVCERYGIGTVKTGEYWVEFPLDEQWIAACRMFAQDGQPVVGELRIFPSETSRPVCGGRWSAEILGDMAKVPPGGLTARLLRKVRIGGHVQHFTKSLKDSIFGWERIKWQRWPPVRAGFVPPVDRNIRRLGRKGKPDLFYAKIAKVYVSWLQSGSRKPVEKIAEARNLDSKRVRAMIHQARKRNLLTLGRQGRPGGSLTDRCREVLGKSPNSKKSAKAQRVRRTMKGR